MGMCYFWSGSASYSRFGAELCAVAELFGGVKTNNLRYLKFIFPEGTNEILVKWFNDIYGDFTKEETKIIWEHISKHAEIEEISRQIWNELKTCNELNDSWYITM